jgi:ABC-type branched-subunit amino acid transport system ATPase component
MMDTIMEIQDLHKSFNGIKAVDGFDLKLLPGTIVSLIGPNGAGKTTIFNLATGLIRPDSGKIHFKGLQITHLPVHKIVRLGISRTFQDLRLFYRMTVLENIQLAMNKQKEERLWSTFPPSIFLKKNRNLNSEKALYWLETVGLIERANDLAKNLSYGQQKLLCVARCLAAEPNILLLDEPISGLSRVSMEQMLSLIKNLSLKGVSIWLIEHHVEAAASISDWIIAMNNGKKIIEGPPSLIRTDRKMLEAYIT